MVSVCCFKSISFSSERLAAKIFSPVFEFCLIDRMFLCLVSKYLLHVKRSIITIAKHMIYILLSVIKSKKKAFVSPSGLVLCGYISLGSDARFAS